MEPHTAQPHQLPPLSDVLAHLHVVRLPLKVKFRGVTVRETALIQGPAGWGEFAPFLEYEPAEAATWLASAIEAAWYGYPEPRRTQIPLNATVPAVPANAVPDVLASYTGQVHEVKIKVAEAGIPWQESLAGDLARVAAVRTALPDAGIKIDANGGWTHDQAITALTALADYNLLYAEQPVPTVPGLAAVRTALHKAGTPVPIAADESVRKAEDPLAVARAGAADLLIIKAAPLGGVRRALAIVQEAGLPAVISSALESSIGIRTGAALAAALPTLPHGCGLDTVSLMTADITPHPLTATDGVLTLRDITPDPAHFTALAAPADRRHWWEQRITACYHQLTAGTPTAE